MWRRRLGLLERLPPARLAQRGRGDEDGRAAVRRRRADERHALHGREALVLRRRLELAQRAHLRGRRQQPRLLAGRLLQHIWRRQRAEAVEQALDEVDLCLRERSIDPHAANRHAVARRAVDDVAPRCASQVRVVEDDAASTVRQRLVERGSQLAQRATALVPVQALVPSRDVVVRDPRLPCARDPHHDDDVAAGHRRRRALSGSADPGSLGIVELQRRRARGRARRLRTAGTGNRDEPGREVEQPGERDLGSGSPVSARGVRQRLVALEPGNPPRSAEWGVRDHRDAGLGTALDDAPAQRAVVERAERDLHRGDRRVPECLVQLVPGDVREPDVPHEAVVEESRERPHGGAPGRARIRRVDEIEVDRQAVESDQTRLAVGAQRLGAPVRDPPASLA